MGGGCGGEGGVCLRFEGRLRGGLCFFGVCGGSLLVPLEPDRIAVSGDGERVKCYNLSENEWGWGSTWRRVPQRWC